MKLRDKCKDLIPSPDFLLDVGEVRSKEGGQIGCIASSVGLPKGIFLRDDQVRLAPGL